MRLVHAAGAPEFQVLFLPTRSGYELLQLLAWLSGLEVPELHHDVSGKRDTSGTCGADELPLSGGGVQPPGGLELGFSHKFHIRRGLFYSVCGAASFARAAAEIRQH